MKKTLGIIGLQLLATPLMAETVPTTPPTAQPVTQQTPAIGGDQFVKNVQAEYKQGKFADVFKKLDTSYQEGQTQGLWKPLVDQEKDLTEKYNTPEGKQQFDTISANVDKFEEDLTTLKKKRDEDLKKVAQEYPKAPISAAILTLLKTPDPTKEQRQAFHTFEEWVSPFPIHAETPLLAKLKQISFEYKIKQLLLNAAYQQGDQKNPQVPDLGPLDQQQLEKLQLALTIEQLNKMQELAQKSDEKEFNTTLAQVVAVYPNLFAEVHDGQIIEHLTQNPNDEAAKKVIDILTSFRNAKLELVKKYGLAS